MGNPIVENYKPPLQEIPFFDELIQIADETTIENTFKVAFEFAKGFEQKKFGGVFICGELDEATKSSLFPPGITVLGNVNNGRDQRMILNLRALDGGWQWEGDGEILCFGHQFNPKNGSNHKISMIGGTKHNSILQTTTEQNSCFAVVVSEDSEGEVTVFCCGKYQKYCLMTQFQILYHSIFLPNIKGLIEILPQKDIWNLEDFKVCEILSHEVGFDIGFQH